MKPGYNLIIIFILVIISSAGILYSQSTASQSNNTTENTGSKKISSIGDVSVNTWANGKKAAFSFTFDDGLISQYQYVRPIMNSFGFHATYYVITSVVSDSPPINYRYDIWLHFQQLAAEGNEIGAHTVTHNDLAQMPVGNESTPGTIAYELYQSKKTIEEKIPDQKCITVAYPFCSYNDSVRIVAQRYFQAARSCGSYTDPSNIHGLDWLSLGAADIRFDQPRNTLSDDQDEFNAYVNILQNRLIPNGKWTVFLAHEVLPFSDIASGAANGFYYPVSTEWLTQLAQWLKQRSDDGLIWVATLGNVTRYIKERQNFSYTLISSSPAQIQFNPADGLDDSIYNYPLTVDVTVPSSWRNVSVSQGGNISEVPTFTDGTNSYAKINIIPDGGVVTLSSSLSSFELSGKVTYYNDAASPLNNVTVTLNSPRDTLRIVTGADGRYSFVNISAGTYTLTASKSDDWGGVNSTDALLAAKYFANMVQLDGLQTQCADVNNNGMVNSTDALMIAKRFVNLIQSFNKPDWVFSTPVSVTITNTSITQNINGLTAGDINKSYMP